MTTFTTNFSSNHTDTTPVSHYSTDVTIEVTMELFKQLPSKPLTYLQGKNSVVFSATGSNAILPYARTINRGCVKPHAAGKRFAADKFELIEHKQGTNFGVLSLSATFESHDVDVLVARLAEDLDRTTNGDAELAVVLLFDIADGGSQRQHVDPLNVVPGGVCEHR